MTKQNQEFYKNNNLKYGKVTSSDGHIYQGNFNEEGYLISGKIIKKNGTVLEGSFENGSMKDGKKYYKSGVVDTYQNGEIIFTSKKRRDGIVLKGKSKKEFVSKCQSQNK
jgi:hypothetical protein